MKRSTWILIGILALLVLVAVLVMQRPGETSSPESRTGTLATYDSSAIDKLQITSRGTTVTLERTGGQWEITSPIHYRADEGAVHSAISRGRAIELRALVSSNPEKEDVFQVDSTGTLVRVFAGSAEKAAFRIGKAGPTYTETFVRREGSNDVYTAEGPLAYLFVKSPKDWRDRTIFTSDRDKIKRIDYRYGDTTFTLAFQDSLWRVDRDSASNPAVQSLLGSLSSFLANDFVDSSYTPSKPPSAVIEVSSTQIRFYPTKDGKYLVQTSRDPQWYLVESWRAAEVLKRKSDLRKP